MLRWNWFTDDDRTRLALKIQFQSPVENGRKESTRHGAKIEGETVGGMSELLEIFREFVPWRKCSV